jgi:hypothetical protein
VHDNVLQAARLRCAKERGAASESSSAMTISREFARATRRTSLVRSRHSTARVRAPFARGFESKSALGPGRLKIRGGGLGGGCHRVSFSAQ